MGIYHGDIRLTIPLSELNYDNDEIRFKWDNLQATIAYKKQFSKVEDSRLLDLFKRNLKGKTEICIHRKRFSGEITDIEVMENEKTAEELDALSQRIKETMAKLQNMVEEERFSVNEVRHCLNEVDLSCSYKDERVFISETINRMPILERTETVEIAIGDIQFDADGAQFTRQNEVLRTDKTKMPFETCTYLEKIKKSLKGKLSFTIYKEFIAKWDPISEKIIRGYLNKSIKKATTDDETLQSFKEIRKTAILGEIKVLDKAEKTLERVHEILKKWGLDLKHRETADMIISQILSWKEENYFKAALSKIKYSNSGIKVQIDNEEVFIPEKALNFETGNILEQIKDILEGDIKATLLTTYAFAWNKSSKQLEIDEKETVHGIKIDDEFLKHIEYVYTVYYEIKDLFKEDDIPRMVKRLVLARKGGDIEPESEVGYDKYCIIYLEEFRKQYDGEVFMTGEDLWFKINDLLIWEEPKPGKATYIFDWPEPETPLPLFIARIWNIKTNKSLWHIYERKIECGFKGRVMHTGSYNWRRNIRRWI